jgi:hypothetical protein
MSAPRRLLQVPERRGGRQGEPQGGAGGRPHGDGGREPGVRLRRLVRLVPGLLGRQRAAAGPGRARLRQVTNNCLSCVRNMMICLQRGGACKLFPWLVSALCQCGWQASPACRPADYNGAWLVEAVVPVGAAPGVAQKSERISAPSRSRHGLRCMGSKRRVARCCSIPPHLFLRQLQNLHAGS